MISTARESKSVAKPAPAPVTKRKTESKAPNKTGSRARAPLFLTASRSPSGAGQPLSSPLKHSIESSLRVDMSPVRIHTDTRANEATRIFSARALTVGKDILLAPGESPDDAGLIAHEAAHVVQQQGTTALQTWSNRSDTFESEAHSASAAVLRGETFNVQQRTSPRVQRLGLSDALNYFADKAYNIPGFRMFTIVLGVNPINMSPVERSAANVMRAVVEFMPGGHLITQALDKYQIFDKVGAWVDQKISALGMVGSSIKKATDDFLQSLSWSDIFDLGGVWERAKHIFTDPIDRIKSFVSGLVNDIIQFVKDAILKPLAKLAEGTRGWDLLIGVLGQNPITGEPVPRTADTLIGGFMKLIGEEETWNNLKKANAVGRAWSWFQNALNSVIGFVKGIPGLFVAALKSLELSDIIILPNAFAKIVNVFGGFAVRFVTWAGDAVWTLLQIILEVVAPSVVPYLKKVGAAFKSILKNPIGFVRNLVAGAKLGFENFGSNFLEHLKAGLIDWLTGSLPGVYIPKAISLAEMGKFAMSVLGISWAQIRAKIVKVLGPNGETIMKGLETAFDVVVALVTGGPAAAWEVIKEKLTNLKDMVIDGITSFVIDAIVKKAVPKLISMFIPGAGFISAIVSIYDTIMVFVQKLAKIAAAVKAFVDSIVNIAEGKIEGAAKKVETTLAGLLSLAISFLAGFLGLGDIASKVLAVIEKVRATVDKAIDTAIAWIVDKAKKLFAKLFGKKDKEDGAGAAGLEPVTVSVRDQHHRVYVSETGGKPTVMIESTPITVAQYIAALGRRIANLPSTDPNKAALSTDMGDVNTLASTITTSLSATQGLKAPRAGTAEDYRRLIDRLRHMLELESQGAHAGTDSDPIPLIWFKDWSHYGSIPVTIDGQHRALEPGRSNQYVPVPPQSGFGGWIEGGYIKVGVEPQYRPRANKGGLRRVNRGGSTTARQTGEVRLFERLLSSFGFDVASSGMAVDHVTDLAFGGPDDKANLWPLDASTNNAANEVYQQYVWVLEDSTTRVARVGDLVNKRFYIWQIR
jgi:hypothetical protein